MARVADVMRVTPRALLVLGAVVVGAHAITAVTSAGGALNRGLYLAAIALAGVLVAWRALRDRADRGAWACMALALVLWAAADVSWNVLDDAAFPSVADWLYLASYAAQFAALGLLMRARLRLLRGARWLDGLAVGCLVASVIAGVLVGPIADAANEDVVATLIYPVLDLAILVIVAVPVGMTGWRPGRTVGWLTGAMALVALTDIIYARQEIEGVYVEGSLVSTLWLVSYLAVAAAAWLPADRRAFDRVPRRREGIVPAVCGFGALAILTAAPVLGFGMLAVVLAGLAAALSGVRGVLIYAAHMRLLARSRAEARQDELSGLPNRRALIADLEAAATAKDPLTLAFFDLDGFKLYNDTFGHGAGDALLHRLGQRLAHAVDGVGRAYRLGGDEFCVLLDGAGHDVDVRLLDAGSALREHGDGFAITASVGSVSMPEEASEAAGALRIADQRMYAHKAERRGPARAQARDLLLAVVRETEPDLDEHNDGVARLTRQLGEQLGLDGDDLDVVVRAAELHDIGKVAIPDDILHKPGPLTEDEWQLMHQHTVIGARILLASPGLRPVAELVRASHERWDGGGYPDALRGEEVPLGARIIAVCDTFDAIVSDRPYAKGRSVSEALAELRRCAGSQFDPAVVAAFDDLVRSGGLGLGVQHA